MNITLVLLVTTSKDLYIYLAFNVFYPSIIAASILIMKEQDLPSSGLIHDVTV